MEFLSRGRWRWWGSNGHYCTQINLARFKVATDWCRFCNIVERVCRSGQKGYDDLQKIVRWVFRNRSCWDCMEVNLTLNRYEKKLQSMMYCLNSLKTEHLWKFQLPIDSSSDCAFSSWPNAEICPKTILDFFFQKGYKIVSSCTGPIHTTVSCAYESHQKWNCCANKGIQAHTSLFLRSMNDKDRL